MPEKNINLDQSKITEKLATYSVLSRLKPFQGPADQELSLIVARHIAEQAHAKGYEDALSDIDNFVSKKIDDYISLITKVIDVISDYTKEKFSKVDLKMVEARTDFHFNSFEIRVMFIIDASFEQEFQFVELLNEFSKIIQRKENYFADLTYLNKRNRKIDMDVVTADFPYTRARN